MEYTLIRSKRKSLAIEIKADGTLLVRAPLFLSERRINKFLLEKEEWIEGKREEQKKRNRDALPIKKLTDKEIADLREKARILVTKEVEEYSRIIGVTYRRIFVRTQKTRWGSCSREGNLNFNCLLALCPKPVMRYVVIHELCHRKYMNHSKLFWNEVSKYMPDYRIYKKWLRDNGNNLVNLL